MKSCLLCVLIVTCLLVTGVQLKAATLFSDNFEEGYANNWTISMGTWLVITENGNYLYAKSGADEGRVCAGSVWTNYAVEG